MTRKQLDLLERFDSEATVLRGHYWRWRNCREFVKGYWSAKIEDEKKRLLDEVGVDPAALWLYCRSFSDPQGVQSGKFDDFLEYASKCSDLLRNSF